MRFLMVSNVGEGAHLLHQISLEGNEVELYIKDPDYANLWEGMIPKVKEIKPKEGTVVIFDFSGMGDIADSLRKEGFATVAGSKFADKLEQDRMFGLNLMEKAGIKVPFTMEFDDFNVNDIRDFLEEHDGDTKRYVFKPSGKDLPCSLTYCSHDSADMMKWVDYIDRYFGKRIDSFVLQEFKEGVCVSTEMWSDGNKFIRPANHTVEVKKVLNGELGQATGCAGNIVWPEHDETCRIVREGILASEKLIVEAGHVGPMDLNAVVNDEGVWGLEWTPRFGYDAMPTLIKMVKGGVGKFMSDVAHGQGGTLDIGEKMAAAVRVTIPPYPLECHDIADVQKVCPNIGIPIRGVPEGKEDCFYWFEVMAEGDDLVHSTGSGVIADVIGFGDDCYEAFEEPYEILGELILPNKQYRTDLDEELSKMYQQVCDQESSKIGENK